MKPLVLLAASLLVGAPAPPSPPQDPDAAAILERAAQVYQSLASFGAEFTQVIADPMIGTFESRGKLVQSGAARFAMRFSDPPGEAIVMDGEHVWVYTPSTTPGQVIRTPVPSGPAYGPNVLAWLLNRPTERYRSTYLRSETLAGRAAHVVSLRPVDPALPFSEAILWLDRANALPRRLEIQERAGTRRTLVLTKLQVNARIAKDTFTFAVPAGVRIVDQ